MTSQTRIALAPQAEYSWNEQCCPLCTGGEAKLLGRRGGNAHRLGLGKASSVYRCRGCGLVFPNPMPVPLKVSEHYADAEKYFAEHSFDGKVTECDNVLASIEELGIQRGRLLDIGTGRGEMLKAARARGWEAVGLEPSQDFAQFARQRSGAEVIEARLEDRPFQQNSFDVVILGAVLEHVFNPVALLAEIHNVLRAGGMLWLDVPNEAGWFYSLGNLYQRLRGRDWVVNLSPTFPPYHVFGFSPRSLTKLLGLSGFRLVKLRTYATPAVIETQDSPVPPLVRALVKGALFLSAKLGSGTYVDAWAVKNGNGRQ